MSSMPLQAVQGKQRHIRRTWCTTGQSVQQAPALLSMYIEMAEVIIEYVANISVFYIIYQYCLRVLG